MRNLTCRQQDGSMLLALLVTFIISALVVTLVATTLTGQNKMQHNRDYSEAINGAEAAVQQAVTYLSSLDVDDPVTRATSADLPPDAGFEVEGVNFEWEANRVGPVQWEVRGEGTADGVTRNVEVILSRNTIFFLAAFADVGFVMRGANSATSYNSSGANAGNGAVGSNADMTMEGNANADLIMLLGDNATCSGNGCTSGEIVGYPEDYNMEDLEDRLRGFMDDACDTFTPYTGGPLQGGETYCFSSMTTGNAEQVEVVGGSSDNPARVFVTGDIAFGNHNRINCGPSGNDCNIGALPDSRSLQIYSTGSQVRIGNQSQMVAAIAAPAAACVGNPSDAQADIFGAIICNDLSNQGGWDFYFDERLLGLAEGTYEIDQWREEIGSQSSLTGN